jgi:LPS-assembly protein
MRCGGLIIGMIVVALYGGSGFAADAPPRRGIATAPVLVKADELQYDEQLGLTIAKGNVELDQANQILLADAVTYSQPNDTVTASGHVALLQPSGDVMFADYVELSDQMRDGFIKDIRLLLSDRSRLAGNTARRVAGVRTDIKRAVYSPCELCKEDPSRPPVWQIKAETVVHDKDLQLIEYYDATMEIDGIPVAYSPYFSHPDPSVKRASGFLAPVIGYGNTLGFHTTIPYYWAIAPDRDVTFRPLLTTGAGVALDTEYRQRFSNGVTIDNASLEAGGERVSSRPNGLGPPTGPVRWDVLGSGLWDVTDAWRAGYQVQRESDQTYMLRYHFPQLQQSVPATSYISPTNDLTTRAYAEYFGSNHYGNFDAESYQSLNPSFGDSIEPVVAPSLSYEWWTEPDNIGGRWQFAGSALNLLHRTGPEVRRLSAQGGWTLPFNGLIGDKFDFIANLRADGYSSDHVALTPNFVSVVNAFGQAIALPSNVNTTSAIAGRVFPQVELKWRYPWVRSDGGGSALIEPEAAFVASPKGENPARIPNEDSQGFEFDEMSLFVPNRLPGFDRVDSGRRVDYGIHGELNGPAYGNWETLIGQSYAFEQSNFFQPGSGLSTRLSDVVGRIAFTPNKTLDLVYRWRVDSHDFSLRREEMTAKMGPESLNGSFSLIDFRPIVGSTTIPAGEEIAATVTAELTRYWSVSASDTRALANGGQTVASDVALTYRDDCIAVIGSVVQSGISVGDVHPGVSVVLTLVFKNLGQVGERVLSE